MALAGINAAGFHVLMKRMPEQADSAPPSGSIRLAADSHIMAGEFAFAVGTGGMQMGHMQRPHIPEHMEDHMQEHMQPHSQHSESADAAHSEHAQGH